MTDLDLTTEVLPARTGRCGHLDDDDVVDARLAAITETSADRPSAGVRALAVLNRISSTPRGAAMLTTWAFAVVLAAGAVWSRPIVSTPSALGPVRVSCGVDVFVYGYHDHAVTRACRGAAAGHFALFTVGGVVVLAGLAAAAVEAFRHHRDSLRPGETSSWCRLAGSPREATLVAAGVVAAAVALACLRPATTRYADGRSVVTARCGADSYFFGYPNPVVRSACRHAYGHQAVVLVVALAVALAGAAVAVRFALRAAGPTWPRHRMLGVAAALALAVVSAVALRPLSVAVHNGPAGVVADCGADTIVAGYPDRAVERACRRAFGPHAAIGLTAGASAVAVSAWTALARRRRRVDIDRSEHATTESE